MIFVVIGYDCSDDKRRNRVSKILMDYGNRVQYSVFEAEVTQELLNEMAARIRKVIDPDEDSVRIYKVCPGCLREVKLLGKAKLERAQEVIVV